MADLSGKKVAVVVDNYFEQDEFTKPIEALKAAGATVEVLASQPGELQAMSHARKSDKFKSDKLLEEAEPDNYDALVLPGGAINADALRMDGNARKWAQIFMRSGKPLAVICHAPWLLASADVVKGRKLTSYYTIQDDMRNAGAEWVDEEVVVDDNLITSRQPDDLPAFNEALIQKLA